MNILKQKREFLRIELSQNINVEDIDLGFMNCVDENKSDRVDEQYIFIQSNNIAVHNVMMIYKLN